MRKPTIYEVLRTKLGREPTHNELVADVKRILEESALERANKTRPKPRKRGKT